MDVWEALERHAGKSLHKVDSYPDAYHRHFHRFQGEPITIVEIGVLGGGSLQVWRSYFVPQARVVGVDIDPECLAHASEGIEVHIGDQADRAFLEALADQLGTIDIVLDDGGHEMEQQITSFEVLYPRLSPTGVYVCEDVHSSYLPAFGAGRGGRPHEGSFIDFAKDKIDELHAWYSDGAEPTEFTRSTASIHLYTGMVVFERAPREVPSVVGSTGRELFTLPMTEVRTLWNPQS
jgi:hypothetical protein